MLKHRIHGEGLQYGVHIDERQSESNRVCHAGRVDASTRCIVVSRSWYHWRFVLHQSATGCDLTLTIAGYTGDSLSLQIIISVLLGLSLYNAVELIILVLVTFQRYHGLYFWSLLVASFGVLPYSLGFVIKFFQLLDPGSDPGYVAVVLLTLGWWAMVSGA